VCECVCFHESDIVSDLVVHGVGQGVDPITLTGSRWSLRRGGGGLWTVAGPGVGAWPWGGRIPSSSLHRDRRWGWGLWGGSSSRVPPRVSELRPWLSGGTPAGGGGSTVAGGGGAEKGGTARCSRRVWVLLGSLALIFLTSLFFSVSLRGGVGFNYLEPPGWEESRRVKLVPSYAGARRPSPAETSQPKTCACPRCVGDPGVSDWFDENYDPDISPVWTRDNIQLPSDVYYWWVVSNNILALYMISCDTFKYRAVLCLIYHRLQLPIVVEVFYRFIPFVCMGKRSKSVSWKIYIYRSLSILLIFPCHRANQSPLTSSTTCSSCIPAGLNHD